MTLLDFKTLHLLKVLAPHRPVEIAASKRMRISSCPRAVLLSKKQVRTHTASVCLHGRFLCPGQVPCALRIAAPRDCLARSLLRCRRDVKKATPWSATFMNLINADAARHGHFQNKKAHHVSLQKGPFSETLCNAQPASHSLALKPS